jgi:peptidoglycan hydrolase-like protein with peptidoglycan-binding domain
MARTIRRRADTLAAVAGLAVALTACGQVPFERADGGAPRTTAPAPTTAEPVVTSPGSAATSGGTPSARPTPRPTATPTPPPTVTVTTKPPPVRDYLRIGDSGPEVLALQQRLSELGYWLGQPDGSFGFLTQQAVWAFQKAAGLSRDGEVGAATRRALADGVRPSTRLSGDGVDIDLDRQILMVVRGGAVRLVLNTSTGGGYEYEARDGGVAVARTPKGTFRVSFVVDGPDEGRLGTLWRPRYFNGGIAVHGAPSIPTYPASHGCARVSNAAMDMIWAQGLMPMGSTVLVR